MERAIIREDLVHFVFKAEDFPDPPWPPNPNGEIPLIIDLVGVNEGAERGDGYDKQLDKVIPRPKVEWNKETREFDVSTRRGRSSGRGGRGLLRDE